MGTLGRLAGSSGLGEQRPEADARAAPAGAAAAQAAATAAKTHRASRLGPVGSCWPRRLAALFAAAAFAACTSATPQREAISTALAPLPIGPYSQAVRTGDVLWLAGQVGIDPSTGRLVEGGAAAEARQALENLGAVLAAAGFSFGDVVQAQVFLADIADFASVNPVYAERFEREPPARATVAVAALPGGARVEIQMVAVRRR
jgi:2-iminobutanoate/2-iminopropanoate deaminase